MDYVWQNWTIIMKLFHWAYQQLDVIQSEAIVSTFDTYGFIYKNNFDPTTPYVNLLQQNGDGDGRYQSLLSVF